MSTDCQMKYIIFNLPGYYLMFRFDIHLMSTLTDAASPNSHINHVWYNYVIGFLQVGHVSYTQY